MSMTSTRSSSAAISSLRARRRRRFVQQRSTRSRACNRRLDAQGKPQNRRGSARKSCRRSRSGNGLGGGLTIMQRSHGPRAGDQRHPVSYYRRSMGVGETPLFALHLGFTLTGANRRRGCLYCRAHTFGPIDGRRRSAGSIDALQEEGFMKRNGQCHCGSLRVVAMGDPERVDLCHCKACQRRPGTAFHLGATYLKARVRLEGDRQIYEREADTGYRIRFHSARIAVARFPGRAIAILPSAGLP